jgi:hypothetical protein
MALFEADWLSQLVGLNPATLPGFSIRVDISPETKDSLPEKKIDSGLSRPLLESAIKYSTPRTEGKGVDFEHISSKSVEAEDLLKSFRDRARALTKQKCAVVKNRQDIHCLVNNESRRPSLAATKAPPSAQNNLGSARPAFRNYLKRSTPAAPQAIVGINKVGPRKMETVMSPGKPHQLIKQVVATHNSFRRRSRSEAYLRNHAAVSMRSKSTVSEVVTSHTGIAPIASGIITLGGDIIAQSDRHN